jgi:hypothetical protein
MTTEWTDLRAMLSDVLMYQALTGRRVRAYEDADKLPRSMGYQSGDRVWTISMPDVNRWAVTASQEEQYLADLFPSASGRMRLVSGGGVDLQEVLTKIWSMIDNPRSMCPDVEIGFVKDVLSKVMAENLPVDLEPIDRWVLSWVSVAPAEEKSLAWAWDETKYVAPPPLTDAEIQALLDESPEEELADPPESDEPVKLDPLGFYNSRESPREIQESLSRLSTAGLVKLHEGRYSAS